MRKVIGAAVIALAWLGMQGVGGATCASDARVAVCTTNGDTQVSVTSSPGSYGGSAYVGTSDRTVWVDGSDTNPAGGGAWAGANSSGVTCGEDGYYGESSTCP